MNHQQAHNAHDAGAERGEHVLPDMERQIEQHHADHENQVGQRGGQPRLFGVLDGLGAGIQVLIQVVLLQGIQRQQGVLFLL